jgi:hypothetical protein
MPEIRGAVSASSKATATTEQDKIGRFKEYSASEHRCR